MQHSGSCELHQQLISTLRVGISWIWLTIAVRNIASVVKSLKTILKQQYDHMNKTYLIHSYPIQ